MSIRVITEPCVRIIGRMQPDHAAISEWVAASNGPEGWTPDLTTGGGEHLVETATRACYWSYSNPRPGGFPALANRVLSEAHGSVLEHAVYTLAVSGVSRSLSLELIRHRHISPSQLSQRYYDESDAAFVVPPMFVEGEFYQEDHSRVFHDERGALLSDPAEAGRREAVRLAYRDWREACEASLDVYRKTLARAMYLAHLDGEDSTLHRKRAREAARSVLPNCVETRMVLTGNARAWRGMIEQRATENADREINRFAIAVLGLLQADSPHIFGDYTITDLPDGTQAASTPYRKV